MKKRITLLLFISCLIISGCTASRNTGSLTGEADKLHNEIISIDTHTDAPLRLIYDNFDIRKSHDARTERSKVDFPRMKQGRLDAVFFAAFVAQGPRTEKGNEEAIKTVMDIIDTVHSVLKTSSDMASLALSPADAGKIKAEGKLSVYIGIENGYAIGNDLSLIRKYYDMGVRYITLCHTKNNDICGSSTDNDTSGYRGLSTFGVKVIEEMNKSGMLVDVSHISDAAFYDVIKYSKAPVFASHSCARALCDNPRNMTDDMIRKLAEKGGVIQVCILTDYLKIFPENHKRDSLMTILRAKYPDYEKMTQEQRAEMRKERAGLDKLYPRKLASVKDIADHIDHIVKIAGVDYVGIGTDFDGGGELEDCYDVSQMKNITVELLRRGYSKEDIGKIWGGNFLRVFRQAEQYASR